jgi:hypothetical protein
MDKLAKIRRDVERSKRYELTRRIFKYIGMILGVAAILTVCITYLTGHRFDFANTNFQQTGLLEAYSAPTGMDVHVYRDDGFYKGLRTNDETVLDVGNYAVKFSGKGYRDWYKEVSLNQGQVLWLNYAVMIPEKITTDEVANVTGSILGAKKTRDNKWILLNLAGFDRPTFSLLAIDDPTNIKITNFNIPEEILTKTDDGTAASVSIVESDTSSRYYLLRHDFISGGNAATEYIYFDRRDLKVFHNISRDFAIGIKSIAFSQRDENQFYIIDSSDYLRKLDYSGRFVSVPLTEHTLKFEQYDDKIVSISLNAQGEKTVGVTYNGKYRAIQTYVDNLATDAYFTNYYNIDYVVIAHGNALEVVQRPLESGIKYLPSYIADFEAEWLSLNASGRFLLIGNHERIDSYDMELKQHKKFSIAGLTQKPIWLDDFYLFTSINGKNKIFEFDGDNLNDIAVGNSSVASFALFSSNKRYLFSLSTGATDQVILQRSKLIVD